MLSSFKVNSLFHISQMSHVTLHKLSCHKLITHQQWLSILTTRSVATSLDKKFANRFATDYTSIFQRLPEACLTSSLNVQFSPITTKFTTAFAWSESLPRPFANIPAHLSRRLPQQEERPERLRTTAQRSYYGTALAHHSNSAERDTL